MDVLSNVLGATNLATQVLAHREHVAPWRADFPAQPHATLHIIRRGSASITTSADHALTLETGDIVLVAADLPHTLQSREASSDSTTVLSATYSFAHDTTHPLLALLPQMTRFSAREFNDERELQALLELIEAEAARRDQGSDVVVPRFVEALFVYLIRAWLREQPAGTAGWLGALRDPQLRRALTQIHQSPQVAWTVESLARSVAMSRAAFAKRFTDLVGEPPLAYITRWRMELAAKMLRESAEPVARIASRVGYISETAFAKAFRRRRQLAPGQYRHGRSARRAPREVATGASHR